MKSSSNRRRPWAGGRFFRVLLVIFLLLSTGCTLSAPASIRPAGTADLTVTQSITPSSPQTGSPITFTITITNNGPDTAANLIMLDTLPVGVNLVSATPDQGTCEPVGSTAVSCVLNDLENNYQATVEIVVSSPTTGEVSNTASAGSDASDPDTSDNTIDLETMINSPNLYLPFISK